MHWAAQHGRRDLVEFICEKVAGSLRNEEMIVVWSTFGLGVLVYCMVSQSLVKI